MFKLKPPQENTEQY